MYGIERHQDFVSNFENIALFLMDKKSDKLKVAINKGDIVVDLANDIFFMIGNSFSDWVAQQKKPIVIQTLSKSRPGKMNKFNSLLSIPLKVGEKLIGVLNLGHNEPNMYNKNRK